jgi:hypothetical protein
MGGWEAEVVAAAESYMAQVATIGCDDDMGGHIPIGHPNACRQYSNTRPVAHVDVVATTAKTGQDVAPVFRAAHWRLVWCKNDRTSLLSMRSSRLDCAVPLAFCPIHLSVVRLEGPRSVPLSTSSTPEMKSG